jgi:hypothetical protein
MMIFAYNHRGIIMTDTTSVTAAYYHDWMQKLRRKNAQKLT